MIYTRTGDKGETSLVGGKRVPKTHPRIEAYGTIDELSSSIGLLIAMMTEDNTDRQLLLKIQYKLFNVGSYLATESKELQQKYALKPEAEDILEIEKAIDRIDATLPKLRNFILPGGTQAAAQAHVCRTVCRRAERRILEFIELTGADVDSELTQYVNRLSDYFFILARSLNNLANHDEIIWKKTCS